MNAMKHTTPPLVQKLALVSAAAGIITAALALSGCGMEAIEDVSTANKSIKQTVYTYVTADEKDSLTSLDADSAKQFSETIEREGTTYYRSTDTSTLTGNELAEAYVVLDGDKCVFYTLGASLTASNAGFTASGVGVEFSTLTANFDKTPLASNGTIKDASVLFDSLTASSSTQAFWAVFSSKAKDAKSITANIKSGKLTKATSIKVTSPGAITTLSINGEAVIPTVGTGSDTGKLELAFEKEGTQKVKVGLSNGYSKIFSYKTDWTAPKANVKKGKAYKSGKKLTIKDKNGFKKITLNGKKLKKSGTKVTKKLKKAGTYTLKATDKAGNITKVKFKVKKKK